jgi:hypothetical protein
MKHMLLRIKIVLKGLLRRLQFIGVTKCPTQKCILTHITGDSQKFQKGLLPYTHEVIKDEFTRLAI